jgi:hypothetical protein
VTPTLLHAIDPRDGVFCHNLLVGSGRLTSASFIRSAVPEWEGLLSPYEAFTREKDKEDLFERVRAERFPGAPPRKGALFLFATREDADWANATWWQNHRVILSAQVVQASRIGAFDAKLLDAPRASWDSAAHSYWTAERTASPRVEVLVDGIVQLEGWEPCARMLSPNA